jgi:hypothetical protein
MVASFYVSYLNWFHGRGKANSINMINAFNAILNFLFKMSKSRPYHVETPVFKASTFQVAALRFLLVRAASVGHCI